MAWFVSSATFKLTTKSLLASVAARYALKNWVLGRRLQIPNMPHRKHRAIEKPRVFVSHSSEDRLFIKRNILPLIEVLGFNPWISSKELKVGSWQKGIAEGLNSAICFILILSRNSIDSEWVAAEFEWAMSNVPDALIPVVIDDCTLNGVHFKLPQVQSVFYKGGAGRDRLISAIVEAVYTPLMSRFIDARASAIDGEWISYCETGEFRGELWCREELSIKSRGGLHIVECDVSTLQCKWSGVGSFSAPSVFNIVWRFEDQGAESVGGGSLAWAV